MSQSSEGSLGSQLPGTRGAEIEEYQLSESTDECEQHECGANRALVTIDDSHSVRCKWQTENAYESPDYNELREAVRWLSEA